MRQCPKCGKQYDDSWGLCLKCDVELETTTKSAEGIDVQSITGLQQEIESVKADVLRLQQRVNRIEKRALTAGMTVVAPRHECLVNDRANDEVLQTSPTVSADQSPTTAVTTPVIKDKVMEPLVTAGVEPKPSKSARNFEELLAEYRAVDTDKGRPKSTKSFEEALGGQWFNKLGVLAVVIGVALLIGYSYQYMGPLAKIGVGFMFGMGLLISGVFLEKRQGMAVYGKTLIAGGWAITYFTTYAMHHIPQVRLISNPVLGMLTLLGVAYGSVVHIQRYRSQTASALTYLLVFITLMISPLSMYTIAASLAVAVSLVYFMYRMKWNEFALYGIAMGYFTQIAAGTRPTNETGFWFLVGFTVVYWSVFAIASALMDPKNDKWKIWQDCGTRDIACIVNSFAAICIGWFLLKYGFEKFLGDLLLLGFVLHLVMTVITYRGTKKRVGLIYSAFAVSFMTGYLAQRFDGYLFTVSCMVLGSLVMSCGILFRESFWRMIGNLFYATLLFKILLIDTNQKNVEVLTYGLTNRFALFALAFLMYLGNHIVQRRFAASLRPSELEKQCNTLMSYAYPAVYMMGTWLDLPKILTAVMWVVFGVILLNRGLKISDYHTRIQAFILTTGAFVRLIMSNMTVEGSLYGLSYRLWTVIPIMALLQYCYLELREYRDNSLLRNEEITWSKFYPYMIFAGLLLLTRNEFPHLWVAPAWAVVALAYMLIAKGNPLSHYGIMSAIGAASAAIRVVYVNIMEPQYLVGSAMVYGPIALAIAGLYAGNHYYLRKITSRSTESKELFERSLNIFRNTDWIFSVGATAAVTTLIAVKLKGAGLTIGLGLEGLTLLIAGLLLKDRSWRISGLLIMLATFIKTFVVDLRHLETIYYIVALICLGLILLFVSYIYTRHKEQIKKLL